MNKVMLTGRLVRDPELKRTNSDIPVVQFTLAVNRQFANREGERQADFINCVIWRQQAETFAKYLHKGSFISVEGQIQTRTYDEPTGAKRYITEVIVDRFEFLETKGTGQAQPRDLGYNDVNAYDIPSNQQNNSFGLGNEDDFEDPFKNIKNSMGVSNNDLPF